MTDIFSGSSRRAWLQRTCRYSTPRLLRYLNACVLSLRFSFFYTVYKVLKVVIFPVRERYRGEKDTRVDIVDQMDRFPREDLVSEETKRWRRACGQASKHEAGIEKQSNKERETSCPENICRNKRNRKLGYCTTSRHIIPMSLWNRNVWCCLLWGK